MYYYDMPESPALPNGAQFSTTLSGNVLFCDTVLEGDRLYTATADDDYPRSCGVYCLNAADGSVIWSYMTENSVKNNVVVANGCVYAQDCEGYVYACLRKTAASTGKRRWISVRGFVRAAGSP